MGKSHYTSNIIGKNSNYIASFLSVEASTVKSGGYIRIGGNQYLFSGSVLNTGAAVVAAATALVGATVKGSLFSNINATKGNLWYFVSDTSASKVGGVA